MDALLQTSVISNESLLYLYTKGLSVKYKNCLKLCFVHSRIADLTLPDHVYKNKLENFFYGCNSIKSILLKSISGIVDKHLYINNNFVYVNSEYLSSWQKILTRISPCSCISYLISRNRYILQFDDFVSIMNSLKNSLHPSAFDLELNDLINCYGLRDLHVHLNGSTGVDWVWQDALKRPTIFVRSVLKNLKGNADELFLQLDERLRAKDLLPLLNIAAKLRWHMAKIVYGSGVERRFYKIHDFSLSGPWRKSSGSISLHPYRVLGSAHCPNSDLYSEAMLLVDLYKAIDDDICHELPSMLHYYLLIQSYFNKLLVQQCQFKGFEQFNKISSNGMRDHSEKSYYHRRFDEMEGMYGEDLVYLEGRFAPKINGNKLVKLLKSICYDYDRYKCGIDRHSPRGSIGADLKRMKISLVGHFIKEFPSKYCRCQHYHLRSRLKRQARILLQVRKSNNYFKKLITGCDAAGNELHTPPDVFAPIFRYLRYGGVAHFTYHAGEDFIHLLSGIRATYEAVEFLNLRAGDRIGHATALGISPQLWIKRVGSSVVMRCPFLLDDLVFAWSLLRDDKLQMHDLVLLEREIRRLSAKIYMESYPPELLEEAWRLRYLDPLKAIVDPQRARDCFNAFERQEFSNILRVKNEKSKAFDLYRKYHGNRFFDMSWGGASKEESPYEECQTDLISVNSLKRLQLLVLKHVNERMVALETMPTSNVRISCYNDYDEHHIFNWLNLDQHPDYPVPTVCICTDDPGVFATNIRNEYEHVRDVLVKKYGKSHQQSSDTLRLLFDNSRRYSFRCV